MADRPSPRPFTEEDHRKAAEVLSSPAKCDYCNRDLKRGGKSHHERVCKQNPANKKILRGSANPAGTNCEFCRKRVVNMAAHQQRDCKVLVAWRDGRVALPGFRPFDPQIPSRMPVPETETLGGLLPVAEPELFNASLLEPDTGQPLYRQEYPSTDEYTQLMNADTQSVTLEVPGNLAPSDLVCEVVELAIEQLVGDKPVYNFRWKQLNEAADALIEQLQLILKGDV